MPRKLIIGPERRTHPLVWLAAIICTIIALAVIITGVVVFIGYMIIRPRVPFISVTYAHLDDIKYDSAGLLQTQFTIVVTAENDNEKAHASFSEMGFTLSLRGMKLAKLVGGPFEVMKNSSIGFNYVVVSSPVPLDSEEMDYVEYSIKRDKISFNLKGDARTRWRVWVLGSVKYWCHLDCELHFHPANGTYTNSRCSSKSR